MLVGLLLGLTWAKLEVILCLDDVLIIKLLDNSIFY